MEAERLAEERTGETRKVQRLERELEDTRAVGEGLRKKSEMVSQQVGRGCSDGDESVGNLPVCGIVKNNPTAADSGTNGTGTSPNRTT